MRKAGLLESPRRGCMRITPQGVEVLRQGLPRLDVSLS
jgi:restriction endonuclease Mrr